jgi:hypothetical protein
MVKTPEAAKAKGDKRLKEREIMDLGGGNWAILNIVGPLLLAAVLLWALLRNRKSRKVDVDRTEQATREAYDEEEDKRRTGDDGRA